MTQEQFDFLSKYEDRFRTAAERGYVRAMPAVEMRRIVDTYNAATGARERVPACNSCSSSKINLLKRIAATFNREKAEREVAATGERERVPAREAVTPKPKRGRKPKAQE